eukprot:TRINITY_DN15718_c0_g1_i1.p1 TRINITY_DN15718_c0_g1~~TRINITY_DN15718_c0_g1_i1.p1  ORF type:complete len:150 (-),score=27.36 TRINITY_DN15718_c0_g1_i1:242-649(-)
MNPGPHVDDDWWIEGDSSEDEDEEQHKEKWKTVFDKLYNKNVVPLLHKTSNETEAHLSCPGCFTPLCNMCQRHESIFNQWRAVVVRNCLVKPEHRLADDNYRYADVTCAVCDALVGAFGIEDEVYHFFHVLPEPP